MPAPVLGCAPVEEITSRVIFISFMIETMAIIDHIIKIVIAKRRGGKNMMK